MTGNYGNPCAACTTNQGCCTLKGACGLMLTREEFNSHFKSHSDKLIVRSSGKFVIISSVEGTACPHLDVNSCKIYHDRPIDCRLFPYMRSNVFDKKSHIRIVFHNRSDCPQKAHLLNSPEDAKKLVMQFARSTFGTGKPIITCYEKNRTLLTRARNYIDRRLSELNADSTG